jgi:hypothetical protein
MTQVRILAKMNALSRHGEHQADGRSRRSTVARTRQLATTGPFSNFSPTSVHERPNTTENQAARETRGQSESQLSQPSEICKTSIPGSNPGGASKILEEIRSAVLAARLVTVPTVTELSRFPFS